MPLPRSFSLVLALLAFAACPAVVHAQSDYGQDDPGSGYDDSGYADGDTCDSEDVACLDDTPCDPSYEDYCDDGTDATDSVDALPQPAVPGHHTPTPFVPIPQPVQPTMIHLHDNGIVWASPKLPHVVRQVVAAANRIAKKPYRYGGGHGTFYDSAYDCSGSVSFALHGGGLLDATLTSGMLEHWGARGRGRYITVYANAGHTFMVIAGMRFDTGARPGSGTRWNPWQRPARGFVIRHPAGL